MSIELKKCWILLESVKMNKYREDLFESYFDPFFSEEIIFV